MSEAKIKHLVFLRRLPRAVVWGGLERIVQDWFERIDYSSCRVTLVVTSKAWLEIFQRHFDEKKLPVEIKEFPFSLEAEPKYLFLEMFKFLKSLKPTVVIYVQGAFTDFRWPTVLAGSLVTRHNAYLHENLGPPAPIVQHYSTALKWLTQRILSLIRVLSVRKTVVLSKEIKDQLTADWGYPQDKVQVRYHGIDVKEFYPSADKRLHIRQALNIKMSDFVFIVPARMAKEKRIERAIDAFSQMTKAVDDLWLLIVGDGHLKKELEEMASQKSCRQKIIFLGHQDKMPEYLNAADCYVNSSDVEGLCIALLEAMACGLVCIATKCAGPTEIIQNSHAGFLAEKNSHAILEAMKSAFSLKKTEREILIQKGIKFVAKQFELNQLVKNALDAMQIPNVSLVEGYEANHVD